MKDSYEVQNIDLREAATDVRRLRLAARRELELARRLREDACRFQLETAARARSDAQRLVLGARLEIRREIEALLKQASEEVQKVLVDIRVIRITAQEELAAQRRFTDAARLCHTSPPVTEVPHKQRADRKNTAAA